MTHKNPIEEAASALAYATGYMESAVERARTSPTLWDKRHAKEAVAAHRAAKDRLEAMLAAAAYVLGQISGAPYRAEIIADDIQQHGRRAGFEVAA